MKFERKRLLEKFVIVRLVDGLQEFFDTLTAEDLERLLTVLYPGRPLNPGQQRGQTGAMIQMQMANPDGVEIQPVEILLGHPVRGVGTAIEQNRAGVGLQPECRRRALRMRNRGT